MADQRGKSVRKKWWFGKGIPPKMADKNQLKDLFHKLPRLSHDYVKSKQIWAVIFSFLKLTPGAGPTARDRHVVVLLGFNF